MTDQWYGGEVGSIDRFQFIGLPKVLPPFQKAIQIDIETVQPEVMSLCPDVAHYLIAKPRGGLRVLQTRTLGKAHKPPQRRIAKRGLYIAGIWLDELCS